jgi:hypothetical protein
VIESLQQSGYLVPLYPGRLHPTLTLKARAKMLVSPIPTGDRVFTGKQPLNLFIIEVHSDPRSTS